MVEIPLEFVLNKLWVLLGAWWWYDKRKVDERLKEVEKSASSNNTNIKLIDAKLDNIQALLEVKFEGIKEDIQEIKTKL